MILPRSLQHRCAPKAKSKLKDKLLIFLAVLLFGIPTLVLGQQSEQDEVSTRIVSYIVIKGDKLKNVAIRFQVPIKTLKKLNKISSKNFTVYPGLTLHIPVRTRPKVWDPSREDLHDNGLLSQDRRPSVDYEIIDDSFDFDIKNDFIATSDAIDDTLQYAMVGIHMDKIDKRIRLITHRIDSFKRVEFNFEYDEADINSVLGRMKLARDKYYINGPLGREIDSLERVKAKLAELRVRLRNRITEYEYLMDNLAYAKENYERDEKNKDTHWGDQITYESNYARSKAKHDEPLVDLGPKPDNIHSQPKPLAIDTVISTPKSTARPDTIVAAPRPVAVVKDTVAPVSLPAREPIVPAKTLAVLKDTVDQAVPATPRSSPFGLHQRVDIAPLIAKNSWIEIRHTAKHELQLLPSLAVVEKKADTATTAAPIPKDTAARTAVMPDSSLSAKNFTKPLQDSIAKAAIAKAADTIAKQAINVIKDTVLKQVAMDITHKAPVAVANKDTIVKPQIIARAVDTFRHVVPVPAKKDTVSIIQTVKTAPDTSHEAAPKIAVKDTTAKPVSTTASKNIVPMKDTTMNAKRITPPANPADTIHKKAQAVAIKANADKPQTGSTVAPKPDTNKSIAIKNAPKANDAAPDQSTSLASRDKTTKTPKEPAPKPEPPKASIKAPEVKTTPAKKPDEAPKQTPVVKIDSSKLKREQMPLAIIAVSNYELHSTSGPLLSLDLKYDSTMLYREKKINQDPLASYKTDSNFVITSVQLKEIPILEVKNKPKYLIPVDSVSRIKGEFYLIRARQVLEKGDFKEGDKYLRKSLELNPNNAATWMLHADLCLTTGAVDKALKEYVISGEIDSTNPKVFYNIALLFAKANDEQKAYKYFSKATDVNDKYLLAYMGRASVLMDTRDYEGAILDYDKTLSINKYYSPAYKGRALAKMEARKFEDAVNDFNQYLEIEDPDGYVLYQRGIAKILSNNLLQGCLDLSSSLELGFKDAEKAIKKFCE